MSAEGIVLACMVTLIAGFGLYAYVVTGGNIRKLLDRDSDVAKKYPMVAAIAGILLLIYLALPTIRQWLGDRKADKIREEYEKNKKEANDKIESLTHEEHEKRAEIDENVVRADEASKAAEDAKKQADGAEERADGAHNRAQDALNRANTIRDEREGRE